MLVFCVYVWNTSASHCPASSQIHSIDIYKYSYIFLYKYVNRVGEVC